MRMFDLTSVKSRWRYRNISWDGKCRGTETAQQQSKIHISKATDINPFKFSKPYLETSAMRCHI